MKKQKIYSFDVIDNEKSMTVLVEPDDTVLLLVYTKTDNTDVFEFKTVIYHVTDKYIKNKITHFRKVNDSLKIDRRISYLNRENKKETYTEYTKIWNIRLSHSKKHFELVLEVAKKLVEDINTCAEALFTVNFFSKAIVELLIAQASRAGELVKYSKSKSAQHVDEDAFQKLLKLSTV